MRLNKDEHCPICGRYDNRGVSIDAVIVRGEEALLIKRGVEPDRGRWGTPGGYVGWDESVEDAARREVKEETNLDVSELKLVGVYSEPRRHPRQVINVVYLVKVADGELKWGDDVEEVRWFDFDALPEKMALDHGKNITDVKKLL